jgi:hypothetical protein
VVTRQVSSPLVGREPSNPAALSSMYLSETREELDARSWAHTGEARAALGHTFRIRTTDEALGRYLANVFGGLTGPTNGHSATTYSLVTDALPPWRYALYIGDLRVVESGDPAYVVDYLLWHVNRQAVERTPDRVLLHAAAVERDGVACILAAGMECGKTTLAAGLVQRGYGYLTDEAVAIEPNSLLVHPFAKALSIDQGSWDVLAELAPALEPAVLDSARRQWQVPVTSIRPDAVAGPTVPRVVITPQYREGAATVLQSLRPAEMLVSLPGFTFSFAAQPRRNLRVLRDVVSGSLCYRLIVGDLAEACALVDEAYQAAELAGAMEDQSW